LSIEFPLVFFALLREVRDVGNSTPVLNQYLSGRVWKRSLPVIEGPPLADAPALKRLRLPQGELAQVLDADVPIRYLACIELRQGTVRGNHFHRVKQEFLYILQGEAVLRVEDRESKVGERLALVPGDLAFVGAGVAHGLDVVKSGVAIEFSEARFDAADTHRYELR
jgi:mannose-6-phosphate isomerase-like protein (cupin superfamily)